MNDIHKQNPNNTFINQNINEWPVWSPIKTITSTTHATNSQNNPGIPTTIFRQRKTKTGKNYEMIQFEQIYKNVTYQNIEQIPIGGHYNRSTIQIYHKYYVDVSQNVVYFYSCMGHHAGYVQLSRKPTENQIQKDDSFTRQSVKIVPSSIAIPFLEKNKNTYN